MRMSKRLAAFFVVLMLSLGCSLNAFAYGNIQDTEFTFAMSTQYTDLSTPRPKWDDSWVYIKCDTTEYPFIATPCKSFWRETGVQRSYEECGYAYTIYQGSTRWMINYIYETYGYGAETIIQAVATQSASIYVAKGVWSPDSV